MRSDNIWKLSSDQILTICEQGQSISEIVSRLAAVSERDLPHTVEVFFKDLNDRTNMLTDAETVPCSPTIYSSENIACRPVIDILLFQPMRKNRFGRR